MTQIDVYAALAVLRRQDVLTVGMVGAEVEFRFNEAWSDLTRTAVFRQGETTKDVILSGNKTVIPWEVLTLPGLPVYIGVYGANKSGSSVTPTLWTMTAPVLSGADPLMDSSTNPTLPVWQQILNTLGDTDSLQDTVADSILAADRTELLTVTATDTGYTCPGQTYEAATAALAVGKLLFCRVEDRVLPYVRGSSGGALVFCGVDDTASYLLQISADCTVDYSVTDLAATQDIPATLPNPSKLAFTGAVEAEYDGSSPLVIPIPEGGADPRYFSITEAGVVSLKPDYRGSGKTSYPESVGNGTQAALPEKLVIPDTIDGIQVTALAPGMFYGNTRVKEVTIPDAVTAIPEAFAMYASNLKAVNNTAHVTSIGSKALAATRIKQAFFPNLTEMGTMAFASSGYLERVHIGEVTKIPERAFADCAFLEEVECGTVVTVTDGIERVHFPVTSIGNMAFYYTRKLRDLPLLANATTVEDYAFYCSRISTALPVSDSVGSKAFPTVDNTVDFWTGVPYSPCKNRITTKLSQLNDAWKNDNVLLDTEYIKYKGACAMFCVMHIHSAITGKYYSDPRDFVDELKNDKSEANLSRFLYYDNWPGQFENVASMFEALGYQTEVYGLEEGDDLRATDFKALVDALASGAYIYAQVGLASNWADDYFDGGHAVVLYGINELGEVCVLDSTIRHEPFRESGFEPDADVYTYTMPFQNMCGPSSNFVVVKSKRAFKAPQAITTSGGTITGGELSVERQVYKTTVADGSITFSNKDRKNAVSLGVDSTASRLVVQHPMSREALPITVGNPNKDTDATNKAYVNSLLAAYATKEDVKAVTPKVFAFGMSGDQVIFVDDVEYSQIFTEASYNPFTMLIGDLENELRVYTLTSMGSSETLAFEYTDGKVLDTVVLTESTASRTVVKLPVEPQYELVQRLELTEELNSVSIDCNLEKFVLYANAPIGGTGANGTLRVYKNNSSEEVYSLWMTSVVAAGGERNMAVTGENKQGIAFISVIPPNPPTSASRTATHNASYIEGVTPFTKIQVSLVSDQVYPVGSVFELWGIPADT